METLTKKQGEQTLIEEYRGTLANTQTYLDSLGKKLDSLEKGSGLDCQHKLTALAEVLQSKHLFSDSTVQANKIC